MTEIRNANLIQQANNLRLDALQNIPQLNVVPQVNNIQVPNQIRPPAIDSQNYLSHCPNATKALCEKYKIGQAQGNILSQETRAANFIQARTQLDFQQDFTLAQLESTTLQTENQLPQNIQDLLTSIKGGIQDNPNAPMNAEEKFDLAKKSLSNILQSEQLAKSIELEKYRQAFIDNAPNLLGQDLGATAIDRIRQSIVERAIAVLKTPGADSLSDLELFLALEKNSYNMNDAKDILKVVNQASVLMFKTCDERGYDDIKEALNSLMAPELQLSANDDSDQQLKKLASAKRKFSSIEKILKQIVKDCSKQLNSQESQDKLNTANDYLGVFSTLKTQIDAAAKISLQKKIEKAQAEVVRNSWLEGKSHFASIHLEVGPEFSILNNAVSLGVRFSFTYSYALNVTNPKGNITVVNSLEAGLKLNGDIKAKTDPISGKLSLEGKYGKTKLHFYKDPESLVAAESGNILKQLLHYAVPPEIPKTQAQGVKGTFVRMGQSIKHAWTTVTSSIAGIFTTSARSMAKQAMLDNTRMQVSLTRLGVFSRFDTIKRNSINKKLEMEYTMHSAGGKLEGKVDFNKLAETSQFKGIEGSVEAKHNWSKMKLYNPLLSKLGKSLPALINHLQTEYTKYAPNATDTLAREIQEYNNARTNNFLNSQVLLEKAADLQGEFQYFCELTCQDDFAKKSLSIHSPRSEERNRLMLSRCAGDRGEYLRALMTRCASLKFQLLSMPKNNLPDEQIKQLASATRILDKLTEDLEAPPIVLSRKNQLWLHDTTEIKGKAVNLDFGFKVKLNPIKLPISSSNEIVNNNILKKGQEGDIEIATNLNINIPKNKTKFYGSHNTGTLSFSLKGDLLLQYGPQLVTNIIAAIREKVAAPDAHSNASLVTNAFINTLTDSASNIANDIATTKLTEIVNAELAKKTISVNGEQKVLGGVDGLIGFSAQHSNTFTISINLNGTSEGVKYGGLNITNTRGDLIYIGGKIPTSGLTIGGEGYIVLGTTENVLSTLGTDTFAPLVNTMMDIKESSEALKLYSQRHKSALNTMANTCLQQGTKLNKELKIFLSHAKRTCDSLRESIYALDLNLPGNDNVKTIQKAQSFAVLTGGMLNVLALLPHGTDFANDEAVTQLKEAAIQLLANALKADSHNMPDNEARQNAEAFIGIQGKNLPEEERLNDNASAILNLAGYMQLMDFVI